MAEDKANQPEEFGIDSSTSSKSRVNFRAGFTRSFLGAVKAHEIGKGQKFFVLDFEFVDREGLRSFTHREFIPTGKANAKKTETEDYADKRQRFNTRIKHLWEAFKPYPVPPAEPIGKGAKDWKDFLTKIAEAFNTHNEGQPIYKGIEVWLKVTFNDKDDLQLPLLPNFIEKVTAKTEKAPDSLEINNKYDKLEQNKKPSAGSGNVIGGSGGGGASASGDFF